jgi:methionyl-tRNA formyltransferase
MQPETLKDPAMPRELAELGADLGVVAAYGRLLPEAVLAAPRGGMINVHASLLPKFRGAAPVHRAIIAGERETGITIMRIVKALDAGPILAARRRPIGDDETSADVERDLGSLGARLLVETVDRLAAGPVEEVPQDDAAATYAPPIGREDGRIDWSQPASAIHNLVRGLHPWPHAYTFSEGGRIIILRSRARSHRSNAPPGTVLAADGDELAIATGDGVLQLLQLQPEGKRAMSAREFLAGRHLPEGARLSAIP